MTPATTRISYLARRNPAYSRERWIPRWREHWALAEGLEGSRTVRRYVQGVVLAQRGDDGYDGVASAEYFSAQARAANRQNVEYHDVMRADEREVFDEPIRNCSFIGEHRVIAGDGAGAFKVVRFLKRLPGTSADKFADRFRRVHAARICEAALRMTSYAQDVAEPPEDPEGWGLDVDASEEIWFTTFADAEIFLDSGIASRIDVAVGVAQALAEVVTDELVLRDLPH